MSERSFRLRVHINGKEIELSGSKEDVMEALDGLPSIVSKISEAFKTSTASPSESVTLENKNDNANDLPNVNVPPDAQCPEVIVKILSTEWGKSNPRTLNEILDVMKVNAIHYPVGTVKGRLTDLTKRSIVRRIQTNKGYGYILIKPPE